jgi:hypothetical protein
VAPRSPGLVGLQVQLVSTCAEPSAVIPGVGVSRKNKFLPHYTEMMVPATCVRARYLIQREPHLHSDLHSSAQIEMTWKD